jgi:hypothetical protein
MKETLIIKKIALYDPNYLVREGLKTVFADAS